MIDEETLQRQIEFLQDELNDGNDTIDDFARRARENTQDLLADFFTDGFRDIDEFGRRFIQTIFEIQAQALAADIAGALIGSGTGFGGFLGALFGGARAQGGPVNPNQAFIVGERGPELFVPPAAGNIVPNNEITGGGSAPANVNVINTLDAKDVVAEGLAANGEIIVNQIQRNRSRYRQALGI